MPGFFSIDVFRRSSRECHDYPRFSKAWERKYVRSHPETVANATDREYENRFVISTRKLLHTVYAYEISNKLKWLNERTFFWLIIFQRSFFTSQDTAYFYFFEKRYSGEKFHFLDVIDFMLLRDNFSNYTRANIFSNAIFFVAFRQERCPRQRHFWFFLFRCIIEGTFCLFAFVHDGKRYLGRVNSCSWGGGRSLITLIWIEKNERWIKEQK